MVPPPPNTPPTANDDSYTTVLDTTLSVPSPGVLENDSDIDGNQLTALLDSGPTNGVVTLNSDGSFQYTPTQGYLGLDSYTYHANDGEDDSNIATVSLTITEQPIIQQAFIDDFESAVGNGGFGKWTESGESDWRIKTPDEINIPGFPSSNLVAHADNCDSFCELTVTNSIDLSGYTSATLSFWRFVDRSLDNNEYLKVKISANGGTTWTEIAMWTHGDGDDDQWHQETFDLAGYLTSDFKVQFITKESKRGEDVAVDEVLVEGTT